MVAEARARLSLDGKPFTDTIKSVGQSAESEMTSRMDAVGKAIAQAFTVTALANYAKQIMSTADEVDNLSKRLDTSAETVQSLGIVATEAGLSLSDIENAILKTSKAAIEAKTGNDNLSEAFDKLGISARDLATMNNEQIFEKVTKAMADNAGDADVLAAAYDVIGAKAGPKLQSVLVDIGEKGFAALNKEMRESGQIMSGETIATWDALGDQIEESKRQLQAWVGEYGGKFIDSLKTGAEWLGVVTAGGNWDDYKASLADINTKQEEINKKTRDKAEADKAVKEAKEAQVALSKEIADLEEKIKKETLDTRTDAQKIADLKRDIKKLTEDETNLTSTGAENYRDQLKIQADLIKKRGDLAKLEGDSARAQADADKAREASAKKLEDMQRNLAKKQADAAYAQMNDEDKLKLKLQQREMLIENIARYEKDAGGATEETVRLASDLVDVEREIANLQKDGNAEKEKSRDLTTEQVKAVSDLRDLFKGMNEKEIVEFQEALTKLAESLAGIAAPDLSWLNALRNLDDVFRTGFLGGAGAAAKAYGEALAAIVTEVNKAGAGGVNLDWLDSLRNLDDVLRTGLAGGGRMDARAFGEVLALIIDPIAGKQVNLDWMDKLKDFVIPKLDKAAADELAKTLKTIADSFIQLNAVDVMNLQKAVELLERLNFVSSGSWAIDIKMPAGMTDGIPLIVPDDFGYNLNEINGSLKILAGLKGVVWA